MKELQSIAHKIAKDCGYSKELKMLERIYKFKDYSEFLDLLRVNSCFGLDEVEINHNFAFLFDRFKDFFLQWVENESFQIGRGSSLGFLEKDLKINLSMLLSEVKEVKELIVQAFVYSNSCVFYDYFNESKRLKEFL